MQLARGFFLTPERRIKRKMKEIIITFQLEHRFTKKQIFEMYANQINLGQRGSFSINGFGEAAQAYFGKDVRQLDLAECALLAGIIQSPNRLSPFRHPERAMERRNLVLDSMVETGAITKEQARQPRKSRCICRRAAWTPAKRRILWTWCATSWCRSWATATSTARDCASTHRSIRICSTLATEAVDATVPGIDAQVDRLHARAKKLGQPYDDILSAGGAGGAESAYRAGAGAGGRAQLRNVAVEPRGGQRPTGSIFKPFVYAAAFATAVEGTMLPGQDKLFSPVTMLSDQQTTYGEGTEPGVHAAQLSRRVLR